MSWTAHAKSTDLDRQLLRLVFRDGFRHAGRLPDGSVASSAWTDANGRTVISVRDRRTGIYREMFGEDVIALVNAAIEKRRAG